MRALGVGRADGGVVGVDHSLDFGGFDDGVQRRSHFGDLDHFGGEGRPGSVARLEEGAIQTFEELAERSRAKWELDHDKVHL